MKSGLSSLFSDLNDFYQISNIFSPSDGSSFFRGKDHSGRDVAIKVLDTKNATSSDLARFKQEIGLLKSVSVESIADIFDVVEYQKKLAVILEYIDGISLKEQIADKLNDLRWFFSIASQISETLGKLHSEHIFHKCIKPSNILLSNNSIIITGFGIFKDLTGENDQIYSDDVIQNVLPYLSPEQTGRMNRNIDYRTDIYSMGVTFYEMLTGILPFTSRDPLETIHLHIAKEPVPPHLVNDKIPSIVSDIVMKLLSKTAEERYQNCFGVLDDLSRCEEEYQKKRKVSHFDLASNDISPKFIIPQIIVGREKEIRTLMESFQRASEGNLEIVEIFGHPGIGKSALVHELHRPIVELKGYFISGKYDQFRRNVPYSSIIQAFKVLVSQILSESDERIALWKDTLTSALGVNGQVITDLIPDMELIIGEQRELPELSPEASQNRLMYVFRNFIRCIPSLEHPLVLFLDDLQWADTASLNLLQEILGDKELKYFLLLISYRNTELNKNHIVSSSLGEIRSLPISINKIHVSYLDESNTNCFISNFLRCDEKTSFSFGSLVHQKTKGNPFFIGQFMKSLYDNHLIYQNVGGWSWDIDKIKNMQVTDNVVELLASKIVTLREDIQNLLKICSCIGNRFELDTLVKVSDLEVDIVLEQMRLLTDEGLVSLRDKIYVFHHDRIQEAAYSLMHDDERSRRHYQIGKYLLKNTEGLDLEKKILYIVNQLNAGKALLASKDERIEIAELNLTCAQKSKNSAAYESAYVYIRTAVELIGETFLEKKKELSFLIYNMAVEAAYLNSDYDKMESYSNVIEEEERDIIRKISIYEIKMKAYMAQDKKLAAVSTAVDVINKLNINLPEYPNIVHILLHFIKVTISLKWMNRTDLENLPEMESPRIRAALRTIIAYSPIAYWVRQKAIPLLAFLGIELTLKYGLAPESAYFFNGIALIYCGMGKYVQGYDYGKYGLTLIDRFETRSNEARTRFIFSIWVQHWKETYQVVKDTIYNCYKIAMETGDIEFAAHSLIPHSELCFFCGDNLGDANLVISSNVAVQRDLKQGSQENVTRVVLQLVQNLMGDSQNPTELVGDAYNENEMIPIHKKAEDDVALYDVYVYKLIVNTFFKDYRKGIRCGELSLNYATLSQKATIVYSMYVFYDLISRIQLYKENPKEKSLLAPLKRYRKMINRWSNNMSQNWHHKELIVDAEIADLKGNHSEAAETYVNAIETAEKNGFIQDAALCNELAAKHWLRRKNKRYAAMHISRAIECYSKWGAVGKVIQIIKEYPKLVESYGIETNGQEKNRGKTELSLDHKIDLSTVIKSTQAISVEIIFSSLLQKLMLIAIENAGAQNGMLFFEREGKLFVEAEYDIEGNIEVLKSFTLQEKKNFSRKVVNYVDKTNKNIVLHDAYRDKQFTNDPHITSKRVKSILCVPIENKGEKIGILYLENNLATHTFTPERTEILKIIAAQAAISIENARLISEREKMAQLETEIHLGRKMQLGLIPTNPQIDGYEITGYMKTAEEVGGDYYDIVNGKNTDWVTIGDVSGHGFAAGQIMAMVQSAVQTKLREDSEIEPKRLIETIHRSIRYNIRTIGEERYITLNALAFKRNGNILFSGLHQDILVYRANSKKVETIETSGTWIGLDMDIEDINTNGRMFMKEGDIVALYSDGVTESFNIKKQQFGTENLIGILEKYGTHTTEEIKKEIVKVLSEYSNNDDITLVIIKRVSKSE